MSLFSGSDIRLNFIQIITASSSSPSQQKERPHQELDSRIGPSGATRAPIHSNISALRGAPAHTHCCTAHSAAYRRYSLTLYKGAKCRRISEWVSEREDVFTVFLHSRIFVLYGPTMSVCQKVTSKGVHYIAVSVSPDLESSRTSYTRQIRTAPYYSA